MTITRDPNDTGADKPKPAEAAKGKENDVEAKKRAAQQESARKIHWDELTHKPVWKRNDGKKDPPPEAEVGVASISTMAPLPGKLNPGWYDVTFVEETAVKDQKAKKHQQEAKDWQDKVDAAINEAELRKGMGGAARAWRSFKQGVSPKQKYKTFTDWALNKAPAKISIFVDDKGGIKPGKAGSFDENPQEFRNCWRQVIRAYTAGMGVHRLDLTYPNIKSPEGINLQNVLEMVKLGKQEGSAIYLDADPNIMARLANPKNKKEALLCAEIKRIAQESQDKVDSNLKLAASQSEASHAFNTRALDKEVKALDEKQQALKSGIPTDDKEVLVEKMKAVSAECDAVSKRLSAISRDVDVSKPSTDLCLKYEKAIGEAEKVIAATDEVMKDAALQGKVQDSPEYKKLQKDVAALGVKAKEVAEKAGRNALPPEERAKVKIDGLREKSKAVADATAALRQASEPPVTSPDDRKQKLEALDKAMDGLNGAIADVKAEASKPGAKDQAAAYQTALERAANDTAGVATVLDEVKKDAQLQARCDEVATKYSTQQSAIKDVSLEFEAKVDPLAAAKKSTDQEVLDIKGMTGAAEKADYIANQLVEMGDKLDGINEKIKEQQTRLDSPDVDAAAIKEASGELEKLEQQKAEIEVRKDALVGMIPEVEKEAKAEADATPAPPDADAKKLVVFDFDHTLTDGHSHNMLRAAERENMQRIDEAMVNDPALMAKHQGIMNAGYDDDNLNAELTKFYKDVGSDPDNIAKMGLIDLSTPDAQYAYLKNPLPPAQPLGVREGLDMDKFIEQVHEMREAGHEVGLGSFNAFGEPDGGILRCFMQDQYQAFVARHPEKADYLQDAQAMEIVAWMPDDPGTANKNDHVDEVEQKFNAKGVQFDQVILVDDSATNANAMSNRGDRYAAVHVETEADAAENNRPYVDMARRMEELKDIVGKPAELTASAKDGVQAAKNAGTLAKMLEAEFSNAGNHLQAAKEKAQGLDQEQQQSRKSAP